MTAHSGMLEVEGPSSHRGKHKLSLGLRLDMESGSYGHSSAPAQAVPNTSVSPGSSQAQTLGRAEASGLALATSSYRGERPLSCVFSSDINRGSRP